QRYTLAVEDGGDDAGVASRLPHRLDRQRLPRTLQITRAEPGAELVQTDGDLQPGFARRSFGSGGAMEPVTGEVDAERITQPLLARAQVRLVGRRVGRVSNPIQRRVEHVGLPCGQEPSNPGHPMAVSIPDEL